MIIIIIFLNLDNLNVSKTKILVAKELFEMIHEGIVTLNLFKDPYNDEHGRRNEIISTRIYIVFMIIGVIVITFYASIIEHTLTYHVRF